MPDLVLSRYLHDRFKRLLPYISFRGTAVWYPYVSFRDTEHWYSVAASDIFSCGHQPTSSLEICKNSNHVQASNPRPSSSGWPSGSTPSVNAWSSNLFASEASSTSVVRGNNPQRIRLFLLAHCSSLTNYQFNIYLRLMDGKRRS